MTFLLPSTFGACALPFTFGKDVKDRQWPGNPFQCETKVNKVTIKENKELLQCESNVDKVPIQEEEKELLQQGFSKQDSIRIIELLKSTQFKNAERATQRIADLEQVIDRFGQLAYCDYNNIVGMNLSYFEPVGLMNVELKDILQRNRLKWPSQKDTWSFDLDSWKTQ